MAPTRSGNANSARAPASAAAGANNGQRACCSTESSSPTSTDRPPANTSNDGPSPTVSCSSSSSRLSGPLAQSASETIRPPRTDTATPLTGNRAAAAWHSERNDTGTPSASAWALTTPHTRSARVAPLTAYCPPPAPGPMVPR